MDLDIFGPYYKVRSSVPSSYSNRTTDFSRFDDASYFKQLVSLDDTFAKMTSTTDRNFSPKTHSNVNNGSDFKQPSEQNPQPSRRTEANSHKDPMNFDSFETSNAWSENLQRASTFAESTYSPAGLSTARSTTHSDSTILKNDSKASDRSASPFVKFDFGSPYFETDLRSKNVNFAFPDKTPLNQPKSTQKLFDDKGYTEMTSPSPAKPAEEIHFEKRHFSNMSPRATHVNRTHISPSKNGSRVSINPSTPPDPYRSSERDIPNAKAATPAASRVKSSNEPSSFSPSLYATESLKDTTVGNPLSAFCLGIDATVGRINALLYELKEREQLVATDATVSVCENALSHLGNVVPSEGKDDEEEASTDTDSSSNSGDDDNSTVEGDSSFMMSNETELFTPSRLGSGGSWWELLQPVSRELSRFVLLHSVAATSPLPSLSPLPARRSGPITTISDDNLNLISSNFDNITQELTGMTTQANMTQIGKALNECLSLLSTGVEHDWTVSEEDVANKKGEAAAAQMELAQYEQRAKNEMSSAQAHNHANNSASSRKAQFQTALRENHEAISQAERILHNSTKQLAVLFEQRKKLACDYVSNERKIASQTSESKQKDNRKTIERNLKGFQKKVRSALKAVASAEDDQRIASLLHENIYKPLAHAMHPNEVHEKNMWSGIDPRKSLNFDL